MMFDSLFLGYYKYIILSGIALVEGPIASLAVGSLVRFGYFSLLPAAIILIMGDIVSDTLYFFAVKKGGAEKYIQRYNHKYKTITNNLDRLNNLWQNHGFKTMLLAKFAYAFTVPMIVSAALSQISYKKFMSHVIPATAIRYAIYLGIGFLMAHSYKLAEKYIYLSAIYLFVIIFIFFFLNKFIAKYFKKETKT